jgi:hypothetical protein
MPISTSAFSHGKATAPEEPKPRVKKADRGFSPPGLEVEPSDHVKSALEAHFQRVRHDREYGDRYKVYRREQRRKNILSEESLAAWREKQTGESPIRVRASELKTCKRQVFFRLVKAPEAPIGEDSPHWALAALSGEELHEELEIALKFLGLLKRSEFNVKTENNDFSGRVDGELAKVPAILDIKTVKPEDFREGAWAEKVSGYISQINAYARLTGNTIGVVLMVDRGSGRMLEFSWGVSDEDGDKELARATEIVEAVKRLELPEAEWRDSQGRHDFKCFSFCPYKELCFAQERDGSVQAALDAGMSLKELKDERSSSAN